MHPQAPQQPFFNKIPRNFLTEEELDRPIDVVAVRVIGSYTTRGEHRKEIIEKQYEEDVEVPKGFNKGHVKLAVNRMVKKKLKGIRARTWEVDDESEPQLLEHKRRVRDFISERGMRDNERLKRDYQRELQKRQAEADALAAGIAPSFSDQTEYGADGLPKFSDKTYVAQ